MRKVFNSQPFWEDWLCSVIVPEIDVWFSKLQITVKKPVTATGSDTQCSFKFQIKMRNLISISATITEEDET